MKINLCVCKTFNIKECAICKGSGIDDRRWYMLVNWSRSSPEGYYMYSSDLNDVLDLIMSEKGWEFYGYADSVFGIKKLADDFYKKGGWFYR